MACARRYRGVSTWTDLRRDGDRVSPSTRAVAVDGASIAILAAPLKNSGRLGATPS
jgi:hypothetical protein